MIRVEVKDNSGNIKVYEVLRLNRKGNLVLNTSPRIYIELISQTVDIDIIRINKNNWYECYIKSTKEYSEGFVRIS